MATRVVKTEAVTLSSIAFIRSMQLHFLIRDVKPNTKFYGFFDGVDASSMLQQTLQLSTAFGSGRPNTDLIVINEGYIITDENGVAEGRIIIPPYTYYTGIREVKFSDSPLYFLDDLPGSATSFARAEFTSNGIKRTIQETLTTVGTIEINIIDPPPARPPAGDPLAQSFFTYGVDGGCYITDIDIYFQAKDETAPVTLQIREMINGYPGGQWATANSSVQINSDDVQISNDASLATNFLFDYPVYLEQDRDYCFVLLTNSNKYFVWTATLGVKSIETGKMVAAQPFIGSMFKSENNITWTADQMSDIKFVMRQAQFDVNTPAIITLKAEADKLLMFGGEVNLINMDSLIAGSRITVTQGSPLLEIKFDHMHGLITNDVFRIKAPIDCTYRGITSAQLTGDFNVIVVDDFNLRINISGNTPTSTGTLACPGRINEIQIDDGGAGYAASSEFAITISASPSGDTATAVAISNSAGKITSIRIDNHGSGYITAPTIESIAGTPGVAASLYLISEAVFEVETNRRIDEVMPMVANFKPANTTVSAYYTGMSDDYQYNSSPLNIQLNKTFKLDKSSILLSSAVKAAKANGYNPTELVIQLNTTNPNISPLIAPNIAANLDSYAYIINNQTTWESVTATDSTGHISGFTIANGGTGYTTPTIALSAPDLSWGTQATVSSVTVSGDAITAVAVGTAGTGYIKAPKLTITGAGSGAEISAMLSAFNSELLPKGGTAKSKYITKQFTLSTVSTGATVIVNAYSGADSNFDVYIRTTLQADNLKHADQNWSRLICAVERNKSKTTSEFNDYKFELFNISPFDVYDIKLVFRTSNRAIVPIVKNFRAVITAT